MTTPETHEDAAATSAIGSAAEPLRLDHIALRVGDRDATAADLCERLDVEVLDRDDRFTLVGPARAAGKLTLLDVDGGGSTSARRLVSVLIASGDEVAVHAPFTVSGGLFLTFGTASQLGSKAPTGALVGATIRSPDPVAAARCWVEQHGLRPGAVQPEVATLFVGEVGMLTLVREDEPGEGDDPMLDHLGIAVASAKASLRHAEALGLEVVDVVEARTTNAVFVEGPDGVVVEYVEHLAEPRA